jgi:hypothetical protein
MGAVGGSKAKVSCVLAGTLGFKISVNGKRRKTAAFPRFKSNLARRGVQGIKGYLFVSSTNTRLIKTILSDQLLTE